MLLPPYRLVTLTWDQLDALLAGQDMRRQKDLVGFRKLAALTFNLAVESKDRLTEEAFMPLAALDGPPPAAAAAHNTDFVARMKEKYGNALEL